MSSKEEHLIPYMVPKNNNAFIDVGANKGMWAKYLSKKSIVVITFEPNPKTHAILKRNLRRRKNVFAFNCALGDRSGFGTLYLHHGSPHDSLAHRARDYTGKSICVPIRRLDDFSFKKIGLIKIDTEKYEIPVIMGSLDTIQRCRPRLIIEVHGHPYEAEEERICAQTSRLLQTI